MIKIKNLKTKAEIYIYGNIISDTEGSWLATGKDGSLGFQYPTKIREQMEALPGLPIDVHIASDGGDVAAGVAIYNMLSNHDAEVTVYIDSWAASIASLIAFAGKKIVMPENTFLMIHRPVAGAYGEADYIRSVAGWLEKIESMLVDTYTAKSVKTKEEISAAMEQETWFTAKEAKDFFPDLIELADANEIEAVAEFKSGSAKAPEAVNALAYKHKLEAAAAAAEMKTEILKVLNSTLEVTK